jgi:branched-chain amino acid transport system ATP-binding protein
LSNSILSVTNVRAGYGDALVLDDVSLSLDAGRSLSVLGRNGVGKTTLLLTLMGLTRLHSGSLLYAGLDLSRRTTFERARAGIGWVPEERAVFPSLSVSEHLEAVARPGPWDAARVFHLFPALGQKAKNRGLELSGGEQQMLAIARALVLNPKLLLLDEPLEGLAPVAVRALARALGELRAEASMAMVLVEQHVRLALELTDRVIVLDRGRVVHEGTSRALLEDSKAQHELLAVPQGRGSLAGAAVTDDAE